MKLTSQSFDFLWTPISHLLNTHTHTSLPNRIDNNAHLSRMHVCVSISGSSLINNNEPLKWLSNTRPNSENSPLRHFVESKFGIPNSWWRCFLSSIHKIAKNTITMKTNRRLIKSECKRFKPKYWSSHRFKVLCKWHTIYIWNLIIK